MTGRRALGTAVDLAAMAGLAVLVWFGWTPVMRYLPGRLAGDVDAVLGWIGIETASRSWLAWVGHVEWLVGAVLVVLLFWLAEKLVGLARKGIAGQGSQ